MKYCNNGKYDFMLQRVEQLELLFKMRMVNNFCNKKRKFKFDGLAKRHSSEWKKGQKEIIGALV